MAYPEYMIRGIPNQGFFDSDDRPTTGLFQFDSVRNDGLAELSINWYDEDASLDHIMNQRKEATDKIQFEAGAAVLFRSFIDMLDTRKMLEGVLSYERALLPGNSYHGNLLRNGNHNDKQFRNFVAASILLCVDRIVLREAWERQANTTSKKP